MSCSEIINFRYEDSKKSEIDFFFEDSDTFKFNYDIDNSKIDGYFITDNLENYSLKVEKCSK